MQTDVPSLVMKYDQIFCDRDRRELAENLKSIEYEHLQGTCLLWKGKEPVIFGNNHVIRAMGFGRVKATKPIDGNVLINEYFLGIQTVLSADIFAPVHGDVVFEKNSTSNATLAGKVRLLVTKPIQGSITIVDDHSKVGLGRRMNIRIFCALKSDTRIEICGNSPRTGFSLNLVESMMCQRGSRRLSSNTVDFYQDNGVKVYRVNSAS